MSRDGYISGSTDYSTGEAPPAFVAALREVEREWEQKRERGEATDNDTGASHDESAGLRDGDT